MAARRIAPEPEAEAAMSERPEEAERPLKEQCEREVVPDRLEALVAEEKGRGPSRFRVASLEVEPFEPRIGRRRFRAKPSSRELA